MLPESGGSLNCAGLVGPDRSQKRVMVSMPVSSAYPQTTPPEATGWVRGVRPETMQAGCTRTEWVHAELVHAERVHAGQIP